MNILAGLSPLLFRGELDSCFKPDFFLCSPFETAAAAFVLLPKLLSEAAFFREIIFSPFNFDRLKSDLILPNTLMVKKV